MFFDDPVAAFANIRRALRPAGRLVMPSRIAVAYFELRPYREGQENALGALGLVCNAVVLWNTRYAVTPRTDQTLRPVRDPDAVDE